MAKAPAKKSWRIDTFGFRNDTQEKLASCEVELSSGAREEFGYVGFGTWRGETTNTYSVPATRPRITGPIQVRWQSEDGTPHAVTVSVAQLEASGLQDDGRLFFCVQPDGTVSLEAER